MVILAHTSSTRVFAFSFYFDEEASYKTLTLFSGNKYSRKKQQFSYYSFCFFFIGIIRKLGFISVQHTYTIKPQTVWKLRGFYFTFFPALHSKLEENIMLVDEMMGGLNEGTREKIKRKSVNSENSAGK